MTGFKIRIATLQDIPQLKKVFWQSISNLANRDYTTEQIHVWRSKGNQDETWIKRIKEHYFLVAASKDQIVGFGSIDNDYLDMLYVSPQFSGKGIAFALFKNLESRWFTSSAAALRTDASKTAVPFFERQGFVIVKKQIHYLDSVEIHNFCMLKLKSSE